MLEINNYFYCASYTKPFVRRNFFFHLFRYFKFVVVFYIYTQKKKKKKCRVFVRRRLLFDFNDETFPSPIYISLSFINNSIRTIFYKNNRYISLTVNKIINCLYVIILIHISIIIINKLRLHRLHSRYFTEIFKMRIFKQLFIIDRLHNYRLFIIVYSGITYYRRR